MRSLYEEIGDAIIFVIKAFILGALIGCLAGLIVKDNELKETKDELNKVIIEKNILLEACNK